MIRERPLGNDNYPPAATELSPLSQLDTALPGHKPFCVETD